MKHAAFFDRIFERKQDVLEEQLDLFREKGIEVIVVEKE